MIAAMTTEAIAAISTAAEAVSLALRMSGEYSGDTLSANASTAELTDSSAQTDAMHIITATHSIGAIRNKAAAITTAIVAAR